MANEEPKSEQMGTNTPKLTILQLKAELWLERSLNHLNDRLNDCLVSVTNQTMAAPTEAKIFQTLVTQLSVALENRGVALALLEPNTSTSSLATAPLFKVCYITPASQIDVVMLATGRTLQLRPKQMVTQSDLQQLQLQKPQSAWQLLDLQGSFLGWLIAATPNELPSASSDEAIIAQLKPQLFERSLAAVAIALAQQRQLKAASVQCQQIEVRNQELTRANQLKSEFLANTSHEIRTPLSSILGFTHLLLAQSYNPDNLRHQEYLNIILTSGQHLLAVINDILDLSKIAANQLEVQWEAVNVPELCQSVLTLVKEKASDKGLELRLELDPRATTLSADSLRLKQMLFNLLSNALKFTNQGTVGLRVKHRGRFLDFTVWDTGIGISPMEQTKLFQPYSQIANVVGGHTEGTGLGLALTQKLAELHGGWVEVQSELHRGSQFSVVLPSARTTVQVSDATSPISGSDGMQGKEVKPAGVSLATAKTKIMVVEDNLYNAKLMTTYLSKLGYQATWVKNAAQMWEALLVQQPALILMDVHLPDIDGLTLLRQLQAHKQYQKIPVIAQTAMAMKGDRETCLAAGAVEYISKPIDLKVLATLVSRYSKS